jgi:hypothetical protein
MGTDRDSPFLKTTLTISILLIAAGTVMAFIVVIIRFKNMAVLAQDILLATMALLLAGAGIAMISFVNGLRARLVLELARNNEEAPSNGMQNLKTKLLDAIEDRLDSISISPAATTLTQATRAFALTLTFKDSSNKEFKPESEMLGLKWRSSDRDVAKVDDRGIVSFVHAGTANVTVTFRSVQSTVCVVTCTA